MEGLLFAIGVLLVLAIITRVVPRRHSEPRGPEQTTEPPGERSAPDSWPRDGGDNPRAP